MGGLGKTCGAVTGAMLVIGMYTRHTVPDEAKQRLQIRMAVRHLVDAFSNLHGTTACATLLNLDISTKDGYAAFKNSELRTTHCALFVQEIAEILEQILAERMSENCDVQAGIS
jgi:C_GCAxxG_C_C family probable redox protein